MNSPTPTPAPTERDSELSTSIDFRKNPLEETEGVIKNAVDQQLSPESFDVGPLRELLSECATVTELPASEALQKAGLQIFKIDITDQKKFWTDEMFRKIFVPYFGKLLFDAFEERQPQQREYKTNDPAFVDEFVKEFLPTFPINKIHFLASPEKIVGYRSGNTVRGENMESIFVSFLTTTEKGVRGKKGVAESLFEPPFLDENIQATVGITHNPAAVKMMLNSAEKNGFAAYFCGFRDGDMNKPLSAREKTLLNSVLVIEQKQTEIFGFEKYQEGMPSPHLISYGPYGIPQYHKDELRFSDDDPLKKTFEYLIDSRPGENVSGTWICIRKELIGE